MKRFMLRGGYENPQTGIDLVRISAYCYELDNADYQVTVELYKKKLPANLRSRVKILVRELAAFNGITYEEFNGIVHRLYYPKRDRIIAGHLVESSVPTNELTPDEARILESELYSLGATLGCPLSLPQAK